MRNQFSFSSHPWRLLVLSAVTLSGSGALGAQGDRVRIRLDADWKFRRDPFDLPVDRSQSWDYRPASGASLQLTELPSDLMSGRWEKTTTGQDVFAGRAGFAWFKRTLTAKKAPHALHFEAVDDNAAVFLNGRRLVVHSGWDDPFDAVVGDAWRTDGVNTVVVLVQNTEGSGGIVSPMTLVEKGVTTPVYPEAEAGYSDARWRTVHLPHDYVVEGKFDERADAGHGSLPTTTAWYRKSFTVPNDAQGRAIWIDFDGVYRDSSIWLNGHFLGRHPGGYDGFRYDISKWLHYGGNNVLAVRVDPRHQEGWWYEGGGIYRHVWLTYANPLHIKPWGAYVKSDVRNVAHNPSATVTVETDVQNDGDEARSARVVSTLVSPSGERVQSISSPIAVPANGSVHVVQSVEVSRARLWSIESPNRYRLESVVITGQGAVDRTTTPFGIRTIRFDANQGFFLNGKRVEIKGTCNHQDHAGVGIAIPDGLFDWRIQKLKEMGSNAYRCSHNPPASELLDACDRLGMIVMDETRHLGDTESPKSPPSTPYSELTELKNMVLRDRNHPSIVMWSMCNEEGIQGSPEGARIFAAMKEVTNRLDPTRPVSCAMNGGWGSGISKVQDLQGFNYGIYAYDGYHAKFPEVPVYGSETASTVSTRGIYANDTVKGYVSAYDVNFPGWAATAENAWRPIAERPWMAGGFVWTGFDYKGEPTPYGWPCVNSHFGILDICGFPKDNFFYYQAWWGDKPVVHVLPHWNWPDKVGQEIDVWCHSNAERVELFLNGKSLGTKVVPKYGHVEWKVRYEPGTLVARGYRGGKEIARDTVATTGAPAAIRLKTTRRTLIADAEDLSPIEVEVVDAQGRVVPTADALIRFSVDGPADIAGVGNGDPSSHEPDKADRRHAFNGLAMVLVGARNAAGRIRVTAESPGLRPATIEISSVPAGNRGF